ncbi:hypothetical protein ACFVHS_09895 [Streptomyces sp. NPDC057746]|uniref:hypothetical protein n=1 Tax=unclassified Streptomyces TaxID=2593676 RepID=UPI0033AC894D
MTSAERRPTGTPAHGSQHPRLPRTGAGARARRCAAVASGLPRFVLPPVTSCAADGPDRADLLCATARTGPAHGRAVRVLAAAARGTGVTAAHEVKSDSARAVATHPSVARDQPVVRGEFDRLLFCEH